MSIFGFEPALNFVWGPSRDGQAKDSAPGEHFTTKWGVTQMTWDMAVDHGIVSGDLDDATQADCATVLHVFFWNALNGDNLPPGVDLMVFNDAMVCGAGHAARLLQRIIGTVVDGMIGRNTIDAVNSFGDRKLIDSLTIADEEYFAALKNAPMFLAGWDRREKDAQAAAYQVIGLPHV